RQQGQTPQQKRLGERGDSSIYSDVKRTILAWGFERTRNLFVSPDARQFSCVSTDSGPPLGRLDRQKRNGVFGRTASSFFLSATMSIAFIFPGQGSQAVGMGAELAKAYPSARAVFEEVDAALSQKLSRVMWEGPEAELTLTENAQPALMAVSLAAMRVLTEKGLDLQRKAAFVAGHSLGEYSALAAAGALSLADAARLLKTRGRAMQEAVPVGEGAMAALLGADLAQAQDLAKAAAEGAACQAANDNAPGQVVISGARSAIERAVGLAPKFGARRAVLLPVSAPFHCALMRPAADAMRAALATVTIRP